MNGAERMIRYSTVAAVAAVAIVAGAISYEHALTVVRAHGESGAVAQAYPLTVDGLIYSASMVLLDAARRGVRAPALARWLLACGIVATLAANVTAGLHFGPVGAAVAAWPALALVGSYELLMALVRSSARGAEQAAAESQIRQTPAELEAAAEAQIRNAVSDLPDAPESQSAPETVSAPVPEAIMPEVPGTVHEAARAAYVASVRGGNKLSERALSDRFGIPRSQSRKIRAEVDAACNGRQADDAEPIAA